MYIFFSPATLSLTVKGSTCSWGSSYLKCEEVRISFTCHLRMTKPCKALKPASLSCGPDQRVG